MNSISDSSMDDGRPKNLAPDSKPSSAFAPDVGQQAEPADDLLDQSQRGDVFALGQLLEHFRPYLRFIAARGLDAHANAGAARANVRVRVDPSDIVQVSCLEACRDFKDFRGKTSHEFVGWLRRIVENNAAQVMEKHVFAQKRSTDRERSLDDSRDGAQWAGQIASEQSSPSQRVMRGEAAVRLAQYLETLPKDQCEALRLRYLEGWPLKDLAQHFERSEEAVAGLLKRGLRTLRKRFARSPPNDSPPNSSR